MPMKAELIEGGIAKIRVTEYLERRARAYRFGTLGGIPEKFEYKFEQDEYNRGVEADRQLRAEMASGQR